MNRQTRCPECGKPHVVNEVSLEDIDNAPDRPCPACLEAVAHEEEPTFACSLFGPGRCSMVPDCTGEECPPAEMHGEDFPAPIHDIEKGLRRYVEDGCRDWELLEDDFVSLSEHLDDMGLPADSHLAGRWRASGDPALLALLDHYAQLALGKGDGQDITPQELAVVLIHAKIFGHVVGVLADNATAIHPRMCWFHGDTLAQAHAAAEKQRQTPD